MQKIFNCLPVEEEKGAKIERVNDTHTDEVILIKTDKGFICYSIHEEYDYDGYGSSWTTKEYEFCVGDYHPDIFNIDIDIAEELELVSKEWVDEYEEYLEEQCRMKTLDNKRRQLEQLRKSVKLLEEELDG